MSTYAGRRTYVESAGKVGYHSFPIAFTNKCLFTTGSINLREIFQLEPENPIRPCFAYSISKEKFICGYDYNSSGATTDTDKRPVEIIAFGY